MLTVENLIVEKNSRKIFGDLSFSLFVGAALVVKGKNGSGKTSLLKILSGISSQTSGKILWNGTELEKMRPEFNADLQFLGHKNFLKQDLSVYENLSFYAALYGTQILIPSALNYFKISHLLDEKTKNLSAGLQKRVMLAKLMICPTLIWLLDEPSVNLDREGKELLKGLIKTRLENRGMVVIASHEPELFDFAAMIDLEDFS